MRCPGRDGESVTLPPEFLIRTYREVIERDLMPFWLRAIDEVHGGVFTCFDNSGATLLSTDKYTWSQGRFVWLLAHLAEAATDGRITADPDTLLEHARRAVDFLVAHAFTAHGHCAFVLTADGTPFEPVAGRGVETSTSADCFVVMGLAEYARVARDEDVARRALVAYESIIGRLERGEFRTEPYPFPPGYEAFSVPMLVLNVEQTLGRCLHTFGDARAAEILDRAAARARHLLNRFVIPSGITAELLPLDVHLESTLLARHFNPGHAIECMWFILQEARRVNDGAMILRAQSVLLAAIESGWDETHGGLLRFVDRAGGRPWGEPSGGRYEQLVVDTWDLKLWWPHSESLYATLLAFSLTRDARALQAYERVHDYTFGTFPNPDRTIGEWIQIRDRAGDPLERVVALPVKDPFHILRNALLILELLEESVTPIRSERGGHGDAVHR